MKFNFGNKESTIIFSDEFRFPQERAVVIIDTKVLSLYENELHNFLKDLPIFVLEASEKNKSLQTISEIYEFFQDNDVNRSTVIYGIGGGITTDIAGFAASTYMRGCKLNFVPTTFLGMIDAAIGGKTAINFRRIKNNIGSFYPAEKIFIVSRFLKTLPEKEMNNGWAECIKISLIKPTDFYKTLLSSEKKISEAIIRKAIELKAKICEEDPFEKNIRKFLNLGHTFAHIFESISNYKISHGTAVTLGIRSAAILSLRKKLIDENQFEKIIYPFDLFGLPAKIDFSRNLLNESAIEKIMRKDKKNTSKFNLILFRAFQKVFVYETSETEEIRKVIEKVW